MKKIFKIFIIILVFLILGFIAKDHLLRYVLSAGAARVIGSKVTISKLVLSLREQRLSIQGLKIYNPKEFVKEPFLHISTAQVDFSFADLRSKNPTIELVQMDVQEVVVVKNKEGLLNLNELKIVKEADKGDPLIPVFPMKIKLLRLNIDHLVQKDYSKGEPPKIETMNMEIKNKEFKNIKSARKLVAVILFNAAGRTSFKGVKIYALASFLGPAALPVGISSMFVGKDHADKIYDVSMELAYEKTLQVLKTIGQEVEEVPEKTTIKAIVSGHKVNVEIKSQTDGGVEIKASARKLKMPQPQFAGGILYQIGKELE